MNRKTFAAAALSLLALAACNAQADVTMEGAESSPAAVMEETATSEAPAMVEDTTASEPAAMEGEVQVEVDAGAAMEGNVQ